MYYQLLTTKGGVPKKIIYWGAGGDSVKKGCGSLKKNIFMVAGFIHFQLVLDRLYKINPNRFFCCKSHVFENIIHLFKGPHNLKKKNILNKNYRRFTF